MAGPPLQPGIPLVRPALRHGCRGVDHARPTSRTGTDRARKGDTASNRAPHHQLMVVSLRAERGNLGHADPGAVRTTRACPHHWPRPQETKATGPWQVQRPRHGYFQAERSVTGRPRWWAIRRARRPPALTVRATPRRTSARRSPEGDTSIPRSPRWRQSQSPRASATPTDDLPFSAVGTDSTDPDSPPPGGPRQRSER
jgi:hypothetical protein